MNTHRLLSFALLIPLVLSLRASDLHAAEPVPGEAKPNIIFLMADDLGYGDLGCFGQKLIQTPNIDRLAREGTRFTQCYAGAAVCAPSRSVLMTGQHTGHTRVRNNSAAVGGVSNQRRVPLEPEDVTVAEVLQGAGYVTGMTGKWGLGEPETTGVPNRQGFDQWFGYLNQQHAHSYYPTYLWRNEQRFELPGNQEGRPQQYTHDLFTEFALEFIRSHRDKPFFLYLPWTTPHQKYEIPSVEPYTDRDWPEDAKVHAAMITRMDRHVGQIMSLLQELKLDERTLVFFCSDNGAWQRRDGLFDSAGPLRASKGSLYEGGIRTPMIARWPGRVPVGKVSDLPWYFADLLPTLADLARVPAPKNIDGVSVLPTLLGQPQDLRDRMMYWEVPRGGLEQAVRWQEWKLLRMPNKANQSAGSLELYNLRADPLETKNVAAEHPEIVARLEAFARSSHTDSPYWPAATLKAAR